MYASPNIMISMFDRMCGGTGDVENLPLDYVYTNVDLTLYANLVSEFFFLMEDSWKNYVQLVFEFTRIEPPYEPFSDEEKIIIVSFKLAFPNASGKMDICIPYEVLNRVFHDISKNLTGNVPSNGLIF